MWFWWLRAQRCFEQWQTWKWGKYPAEAAEGTWGDVINYVRSRPSRDVRGRSRWYLSLWRSLTSPSILRTASAGCKRKSSSRRRTECVLSPRYFRKLVSRRHELAEAPPFYWSPMSIDLRFSKRRLMFDAQVSNRVERDNIYVVWSQPVSYSSIFSRSELALWSQSFQSLALS